MLLTSDTAARDGNIVVVSDEQGRPVRMPWDEVIVRAKTELAQVAAMREALLAAPSSEINERALRRLSVTERGWRNAFGTAVRIRADLRCQELADRLAADEGTEASFAQAVAEASHARAEALALDVDEALADSEADAA